MVNRQGAVHGQLVANLRFSTAELTVDLNQGLGLKAAAEEVVDGLNPGGQLLHFTAALEEGIARNESADVGHFLGSGDDLGGHSLSQLGFLCEVGRRHDSEAQEFLKSCFAELLGGGRSHTRQVFDGHLYLLFFGH